MRVKKYLALTLAALFAATMLTGCPWDIEDDAASDSSSAPSSSSRPSDDEDDDPVMYTVTASVTDGAGGTVSVIPASVAAGGSVTVTITPEDNYQLASVIDNEKNVTSEVINHNTYTIQNVAEDHTITVTFKLTIDLTDPKTWPRNGSTIIAPEGIELNAELADKMLAVEGVDSVDLSQSGITSIQSTSFTGQTKLVSITVPNDTTIETSAFFNCAFLRTVNGTLTSVGDSAFQNCENLTSIAVNGEVGNDAFQGCSSLQNLWLGENFPIGEGANPFSGAFSSVSKLHVHYSGPESETIKSIFGNLGIDVDYHWGCNGSDRAPTPALNSGLASLLLGL